jgi:Mce-associated membrane protein
VSDAPRPAPRPRPQPVRRAEPQPPVPPAEPEPPPEPGLPEVRRTRAERRAAERRADRPTAGAGHERLLRRILVGALVVAGLAGAASVIITLTGTGAKPARSAAASTAAAAAGARFTQPDRAAAFMAGATSDITAVTSYDYRHLDDALAAGTSVSTGAYRTAFAQALRGQLAATARADRVVHDFDVLDVGIGEMAADGAQAKVLLFGRQVVTDRTHPHGAAALVTLCATMQRRGNRYLISELTQDGNAGLPPGTPELAAAAEAARSEVVNLLTYTRDQFDADLRRALAGAVDPLHGQLEQKADATRAAMTKGRYDLSGLVTSVAVKSVAGSSAVLLVAADASRLPDSGAASDVAQVRYEVTVSATSAGWRAAQVNALAAQ